LTIKEQISKVILVLFLSFATQHLNITYVCVTITGIKDVYRIETLGMTHYDLEAQGIVRSFINESLEWLSLYVGVEDRLNKQRRCINRANFASYSFFSNITFDK